MNDTNPNEKKHDFKDDANKAAEGVKNLADSLKKHDFKAELLEAFAEAKKNPSSILEKPDAPRPGKDLAVAGLAAAGVLLLLLFVTSGAFFGVVCLVLGIGALLLGLLGLKTEGRMIAFASTGAGLLAILLSIGQIRSATRKPDPKDELIRLMAAQLAQQQSATSDVAAPQPIQQPNASGDENNGAIQHSPEAAKPDENAQVAEALLARLKSAEARQDVQELAKVLGQLQSLKGPLPDGAEGWMASARDTLKSHAFGALRGGKDGQASASATQSSYAPPPPVPSTSGEKYDPFAFNKKTDMKKDRFGHEFRMQDDDPPAGPSGARIDEILPVLKNANIETMVIDLPNKVRLLLSKLPDGSFMGTFEVTQDQWLAVMGGENPSAEDNVGDDHPVDSIWPADCLSFVEKLNNLPDVKKDGIQFRIPSEEEWEKACLAGNTKSRDFGLRLDGEKVTKKNFGEIAWCMDNFTRPSSADPDEGSGGISHSVGRRQPNAFGLYDMHGNVSELTFAKPQASSHSRFVSKGGYWQDNMDWCEAYKTGRGNVMEEPPKNYSGAKQPTNYSLGFRVAASAMDKDISRILAAAEKVAADGGAAFFGFYPGMSEADATKLAEHYGLSVDDPFTRDDGYEERNAPGRCQLVTNPATKEVVQVRFDMQSVQALTKESFKPQELGPFCDMLSKHVGNLECIRDGKNKNAPNVPPKGYLYQRKTTNGTIVSFEEVTTKTRENNSGPYTTHTAVLLTLENTAAVASLAAARMAAANNARIEAVEPVLREKGIKTKTIELPSGVKLLLTELPDGRYMGTFEVTQAQYASLMVGENPSQCVGADLPVDSVSVQDCLAFIEKANDLPVVKDEGLRFQLPSLADWKTACRAGTEGDYTRRLDGTDVTKNYSQKFEGLSDMTQPAEQSAVVHGPHPVGATMPNAFGLYDMFGNVSEWVADKVQNNPYHAGKQFHLGWSWNGMNADPKIRADGTNDHYEFDAPEKTSSSRGFRVSVISQERDLKRAKEEAAKAYTLSNNGRIDAVKPVLEKAGIVTKEIELPGGLKLLLNKTPDGAWAGAFEVTQGLWKSLLHDNPSSFKGDPVCTDEGILSIWRSWNDENPEQYRGTGLPVDQMSPGDIQTFLVLLNALPSVREAGLTFHLPTQDEWLYIARAGAKSKYAKPLDGGDASVGLMGWYKENIEAPKSPRLQIVGQKQPNAFGLYDVHGNAAEYTESGYGGGHSKPGFYAIGGSVNTEQPGGLAINRPIAGHGESFDDFNGPRTIEPFRGFRVVATEGGLKHLVDPEMAATSNARIDAVKPALETKGIETKILDLTGGVKLLMNKLPGGLWAGAFEVTQAQFMSILGENPSIVLDYRKPNEVSENPWQYRTGDRPVDNVRKVSADAFMRALNAMPCAKEAGLTFRLPSCEEWTKFCGFQLKEYTFKEWAAKRDLGWLKFGVYNLRDHIDDYDANSIKQSLEMFLELEWESRFASISLPGGKWDNLAWFPEEENGKGTSRSISATHPVGEKESNRYGLYDIFGNVAEWTSTRSLEQERRRKREGGTLPGDEMLPGGKIVVVPNYFISGGSVDKEVWGFAATRAASGVSIGFRVWAEAVATATPDGVAATSATSTPAAPAESAAADPFAGGTAFNLPTIGRILMKVSTDPTATKLAVETTEGKRIMMTRQPNGEWVPPTVASDTVLQAAATKSAETNSAAIKFVHDSNDRIDAVKPVLDGAGIETKTIELPSGALILMNKLPNGAWIGAFEVTQAQFASVFGTNPSRTKGGDRAVENVSWNHATIYAAVLNELPSVKASGLHFRLPSNTEWETACRGGGGIAPQGKPLEKGKGKLDDMGWYNQNSDVEGVKQTHRVGLLQPNAFGLYDMIGNVAEWTATAYTYEGTWAHTPGSQKIWRGGSWLSPKEKCTAAYRGLLPSDTRMPDTGFRLYATEDGSDAKEENVVFRDKEYRDATQKERRPDDRSREEKLIGTLIELHDELEKAELQDKMEELKLYMDLLNIDPASMF